MPVRALSFGSVAQAYERYRPGYPDEVFELVARYAGRPIRAACEIGAGTGKATRLFAGHGVPVTATEPDPAMLAELRRHAPATVVTRQAAFEELPTGQSFDLVYAAAALHWTKPEGRWPRVAAMLVPDGVFACFGGPMRLTDPALERTVRAARAPFLEADDIPSPDGTPPHALMQWPGTELRATAEFTDVRQHVIPRQLTMSAEDFAGHLSTLSAYLELPAGRRRQALAAVAGALPASVELTADIVVHLARRC